VLRIEKIIEILLTLEVSVDISHGNNADEFYENAKEFLKIKEAQNCLVIGITDSVRKDKNKYSSEEPIFLILKEESSIVGCALMTPPYHLLITELTDRACENLSEYLIKNDITIPGVLGPKESAHKLANLYADKKKLKAKLKFEERVFQINKVIHPKESQGVLKFPQMDKLELLVEWGEEFCREAQLPEQSLKRMRRNMVTRIEEGGISILEVDGKAVSMAGYAGKTPSGIRLGLVYTPHEFRNHGYASELTAKLSQHLLDHGNDFCFLLTDLSNPTSNSIYKKIGYEEVCDLDMVESL